MARYGTNIYSDNIANGGFLYGQSPQIALSIEPFTATALDYQKVEVAWTPPVGDFLRFRLVRNQDGVPDTEEDGVFLIDTADLEAVSNTTSFIDGVDNTGESAVALSPGKYTHYSIWLLLTNDAWYNAGQVTTILAKRHEEILGGTDRTRNTHERVMDLLPRVFTSVTNSALDVVDTESDLYTFLYGFSYTLDELFTYIDLLVPNHLYTNFSASMLDARAYEYGFSSENRASTKFQRRLVREAPFIASRKGTLLAIETLVESISGYIPTITPSPNLMLSTQDSTFRGGIGAWQTEGACVFSLENTVIPSLVEPRMLERGYTAKAVVSTAGAKITNGVTDSVTRGVPVKSGTSYSFSGYFLSSSASGSIVLTLSWFDRLGVLISSNASSSQTVGTSWVKKAVTATAPATAVYAGVTVTFGYAATYHVDMVQVATSDITVFHEARGVEIQIAPTKQNLITNPSFEAGTYTAGWTIVGTPSEIAINSSVTGPLGINANNIYGGSGSSFLRVTGGGSGNSVSTTVSSITPGKFYTFSIYAQAVTGTLDQTITLSASSALLGTSVSNSVTITATTTWDRYQVNVYVPTEYTDAVITATVANAANTSAAINFEAAQLESGFKATDYFDGSFINNGSEWSGTAHASTSYMFQNKGVKIPRLQQELPKYLPIGMPYILESQDGIEFSGFA